MCHKQHSSLSPRFARWSTSSIRISQGHLYAGEPFSLDPPRSTLSSPLNGSFLLPCTWRQSINASSSLEHALQDTACVIPDSMAGLSSSFTLTLNTQDATLQACTAAAVRQLPGLRLRTQHWMPEAFRALCPNGLLPCGASQWLPSSEQLPAAARSWQSRVARRTRSRTGFYRLCAFAAHCLFLPSSLLSPVVVTFRLHHRNASLERVRRGGQRFRLCSSPLGELCALRQLREPSSHTSHSPPLCFTVHRLPPERTRQVQLQLSTTLHR